MSAQSAQTSESVLRSGCSAEFLGTGVEVLFLDAVIQDDAVLWEGSGVIPYTHFSLSLSAWRRLARWVGWNLDGANLLLLSRSGLDFAKEPRLSAETVPSGLRTLGKPMASRRAVSASPTAFMPAADIDSPVRW